MTSRRLFLRTGASVGALALLTGCSVSDSASAERLLRRISEFNDWVQARLFNPGRLAPTYPESAIARPFRFNAYYAEADAPDVDEERYRLVVDGLVDNKRVWTLEQLNALPQETQITRLVCVEGDGGDADLLEAQLGAPALDVGGERLRVGCVDGIHGTAHSDRPSIMRTCRRYRSSSIPPRNCARSIGMRSSRAAFPRSR